MTSVKWKKEPSVVAFTPRLELSVMALMYQYGVHTSQ